MAGPASAQPTARVTPIARDSHLRRTAPDAPRAGERSERADASPGAPPDVHIHIGRVEFTAMAALPQPRRQRPAAAKPAMALDEYLKRRSEGTR